MLKIPDDVFETLFKVLDKVCTTFWRQWELLIRRWINLLENVIFDFDPFTLRMNKQTRFE